MVKLLLYFVVCDGKVTSVFFVYVMRWDSKLMGAGSFCLRKYYPITVWKINNIN